MTSSANPQHEPTMEEILASIRKIISEDQPDAEKASVPAAAPMSQPTPVRAAAAVEQAAKMDADVLELTEEVQDTHIEEVAPEEDESANDIAFETIDDQPKANRVIDDSDLISDSTRRAMGNAFAGLDDEPQRFSAQAGGTLDALFVRAIQDTFVPTLKDWVDDHQAELIEEMRPLIREWMDDNLPSLIETAVSKEIARAAAARPRRR